MVTTLRWTSQENCNLVKMSDVPGSNRKISLLLSEALDEICVNERILMKRRRSALLEETINTIRQKFTNNSHHPYLLGSSSEGTTTIGLDSDIDVLCSITDCNVIQDWAQWEPGKLNLLMVQDEITAPGYCLLQRLRHDAPLPMTTIPNDIYTRDRRGRILLKNTFRHDTIEEGEEIHGPAFTTPGRVGKSDRDFVHALPCPWPHSATSWLERHCPYKWPTQDIRNVAMKSKCFVVPVSSKVSIARNIETEWRISTCLAERCLMFSLNITQLRCYVLMKIIIKTLKASHGEHNLSSFMCKTVLMHCVANLETNIWQECNLFTCLTYCLLELHSCIQNEQCQHFIIAENNLMAGQFSAQVKQKLLDWLSSFIQNEERALFRIGTDNLGQRLKIKLNIMPHTIDHLLCTHTSCYIEYLSSSLYKVLFSELKRNEEFIFLKAVTLQDLFQLVKKLISYSKDGNIYEQTACRFLAPQVFSTTGTSLASFYIGINNPVSSDILVWFAAGLNSDIFTSMLKLASVFVSTGEMEKAEYILRYTERRYDASVVLPLCGCWEHRPPDIPREFGRICAEHNEDVVKHYIAPCVSFRQREINCIPDELQPEMSRSTPDEMLHRVRKRDDWMDFAVVDTLPYIYFLQYKTYRHLRQIEAKQRALHNLVQITDTRHCDGHRETAMNLLGQCMEQENRQLNALQCYRISLQIRSTNNAATFHLRRIQADHQ